ncbi:hypothetical protein TrCOL_g6699 [Triparma columacea]|uniref:phosphomevalonate kinase n=1 Tax=Triparma columacea TaxID=722753 RepID=A0A9W7LG60_9STRA|nr:hypothetical protein TrCOL_g6699 [Triparma columacea]
MLGGYTILRSPNPGVSLATSARFRSTLTLSPLSPPNPPSDDEGDTITLTVESSQFHTVYTYLYTCSTSSLTLTESSTVPTGLVKRPSSPPSPTSPTFESTHGNKYVQACVETTLEYFRPQNNNGVPNLTIQLHGDREFYTGEPQQHNNNGSSSTPQPYVAPIVNDVTTPTSKTVSVQKTGLGSSACLCTSLVSTISHYFNPSLSLHTIHKIAQVAHCEAQGKVGSGFDVATAVYGSCFYTRFTPWDTTREEEGIRSKVVRDWDYSCSSIDVTTRGWSLMLGDVMGGSESEGMARKVMKFVNGGEDEGGVWRGLEEKVKEGVNIVKEGTGGRDDDLEVREKHNGEVREKVKEVRRALKRLGELAEVGIEPDEQTELCDGTTAIEGVVCAGVPGAGGRDAIYAIVEDGVAKGRVEELWRGWGGGGKVRWIEGVDFDREGGLVVEVEGEGGTRRTLKGKGRLEEVGGWGIKRLLKECRDLGLSVGGCVEKGEIVDKLKEMGYC